MRNVFSNINVIPWYKWIFLSSDDLPGVTLYFLSRRNSTSPRFFPLYENTNFIRIVLVKGFRFPHLDFVSLRLLRVFLKAFRRNFSRYNYFFLLDIPSSRFIKTNQILQIDDPTYSTNELRLIKDWELQIQAKKFKTKIIVTTEYMRNYFQKNLVQSEISIISQGFSPAMSYPSAKVTLNPSSFKLVYISPYIDTLGDPHAGHHMWDATVLLDEIWTKVSHLEGIELHLIGRVGKNAGAKLTQSNVFQHGFKSIAEVSAVLPYFDLALYPRTYDNRWQPQKIIEYMGAGVPILAFKLIDTELIKQLSIGVLVENTDEFVKKIHDLSRDRSLLQLYRQNCLYKQNEYNWKYLGQELDKVLENPVLS